MRVRSLTVVAACLLGCGDDADDTTLRWQPTPGTSWQWQLQGTIDTSVDAAVFDIDLHDAPQAVIDELHAAGKHVICYFDTAYEPGRPDSDELLPYIGDPIDGWPGQYWLDIREPVVRDVMIRRLQLAADKRCDGVEYRLVEYDDVDVASNDTMLGITPDEQLEFIRLLAREGHARGLAVGLKNDLEQVTALVGDMDFAVNEQCFEYDECDLLDPFVAANKAVFGTEYTEGDLATLGATVCPRANAKNFDTLIKHLDLGVERHPCR